MIWFIFSILTAFFESMKDVFSKKSLKNIDDYIVSWSYSFFSLPFLIPILFFMEIPSLSIQFWIILIIAGFLGSISTILYMKAIKSSDLSITTPMLTFVPLFLLITSPIMLYKSQKNLDQIKTGWKALIPIGFFSALTLIFQMNALKLALVVYVISMKRTSVILDVLLGHFIFKEKNVYERLIGAVIMVIGVLFIGFS